MTRPMVTRQFHVGGHRIELRVPAQPDDILNEAVTGDSADPYWGKVWDAAPLSAECLVQTQWPEETEALELGCGCGLLGIAGLLAGLKMTFSDHDAEAVELAVDNAQRNGFDSQVGIVLDWNSPPELKFDLLVASDVLYEQECHRPLLATAEKLLKSDGSFRIGDPGRQLARSFVTLANDENWQVEIYDSQLHACSMPVTNEFQWLVLQRR